MQPRLQLGHALAESSNIERERERERGREGHESIYKHKDGAETKPIFVGHSGFGTTVKDSPK